MGEGQFSGRIIIAAESQVFSDIFKRSIVHVRVMRSQHAAGDHLMLFLTIATLCHMVLLAKDMGCVQ